MGLERLTRGATEECKRCVNNIVALLNANKLANVVYDDFTVGGMALGKGSSPPGLEVFQDGLEAYAFTGTGAVTEEAFFTVHLLHGLKQGTNMTFHVHWSHKVASPSGNVKWQVEYSMARGYGVGTFPSSTTVSSTQAAPAQYVHQISPDDDMTVTTSVEMEPDSLILGRVFRDPTDGADTFEDDAFLFQVDMHYQRGWVGTAERNREWTSTGY